MVCLKTFKIAITHDLKGPIHFNYPHINSKILFVGNKHLGEINNT